MWNIWLLTWCTQGRWPGIEQMGQSTPACSTQQVSSQWVSSKHLTTWDIVLISVPDPDPPDPHVFGPAESGSFYHQAKKGKKNLDSHCFVTFFWLFIFEKLCKCTLIESNMQENFYISFLLGSSRSMTKTAEAGSASGSRSTPKWHGSGYNKGTVVREAGHGTRDNSPSKYCRFDTST
jgi:hypothetical protein